MGHRAGSLLDLSGIAAGSVAAELEAQAAEPRAGRASAADEQIAAPAIAMKIAPPYDDVENINSTDYQEQVAQGIAAGITAIRSKLPEVRP